jgi:A/G-specific adenine glycosylase
MTDSIDAEVRDHVRARLLAWFSENARDLPWRRDRTPYHAWVAEVMLQQTRVETVQAYYERFLDRFPTLSALAAAELGEVLKVWEGLGYYARARHLHAAARQVMAQHGGRLPDTFEELVTLPGIGRYTGGALASLVFGRAVPAVDGNVRRVLCRLFAISDDVTLSRTQRRLEDLAAALLPPDRVGAFNEALMELGATVCTPRSPDCEGCPLRELCEAYRSGDPEALPGRRPRQRTPHYDVAAAVLGREDGRVLVAQRKPDAMLGGLWEFPGGKRERGETLAQCLRREMMEELGVEVAVDEEPLLVLEHGYTHFRITLYVFACVWVAGEPRCLDCADFRWLAVDALDDVAMAVTDRQIAQYLQEVGF